MAEEKNKKLNTALLIVLGVLVVAIVIALIKLHNVNSENEKAFNQEMQDLCKFYQLQISKDDGAFIVNISPDRWRGSDAFEQQTLCSAIYTGIMVSLWNNKIYNEGYTPLIYYYVDKVNVAIGSGGEVEMK